MQSPDEQKASIDDTDEFECAKDESRLPIESEDFEIKGTSSQSVVDNETQEEVDDIPDDFFDDFSNQDFMAGLDVVDAWDDEEEETKEVESESSSGKKESIKSELHQKDLRERVALKKDQRRDPEKSKRDILKYKDKCAKDREAKIISEKLKVVETGLVPPGMEMEVDLQELKQGKIEVIQDTAFKKKISPVVFASRTSPVMFRDRRETSPTTLRDRRDRVRRSRSRSFDRMRRGRASSPCPVRSRQYNRSAERKRLSRERSPIRRRHRRSRSRTPTFKDKTIERRHHEDRIRPRKSGAKRSRDKSYSPVSERELWLRNKNRRESSSKLDNTSRNVGFLEELADKLKSERKKKNSLMKQIQKELNDVGSKSPRYNSSGREMPRPVPVPRPPCDVVPPQPPQFQPFPPHHPPPPYGPPGQQSGIEPVYDEQFFIGQTDLFPPPAVNNYGGFPDINIPPEGVMNHDSQFHSPYYPPNGNLASQPQISPLIVKTELFSNNIQISESPKNDDQKTITKLFEDKKISLTDFLTVTAKPGGTKNPQNLQKRIRVISLCQDALKYLGEESKLGGRFFYLKSNKVITRKDVKFQSPLRKVPVVRFNFTTPPPSSNSTTASPIDKKKRSYSNLSKLLVSLGFPNPFVAKEPQLIAQPTPSPECIKLTLPVMRCAKMSQTDPTTCPVCDLRKAREFVDKGTQCDQALFIESSSQVTEEDLYKYLGINPPQKDVLKNRSLANLTPAQLLSSSYTDFPSEKSDRGFFQGTQVSSKEKSYSGGFEKRTYRQLPPGVDEPGRVVYERASGGEYRGSSGDDSRYPYENYPEGYPSYRQHPRYEEFFGRGRQFY